MNQVRKLCRARPTASNCLSGESLARSTPRLDVCAVCTALTKAWSQYKSCSVLAEMRIALRLFVAVLATMMPATFVQAQGGRGGGCRKAHIVHALLLRTRFIATAVVADIARMHAIDRSRVFATGLSNGAILTHRLASEAADTFVRDHGRRPSMAARDRERCALAGREWRIVSESQRK